jgi:hypothetical protein
MIPRVNFVLEILLIHPGFLKYFSTRGIIINEYLALSHREC